MSRRRFWVVLLGVVFLALVAALPRTVAQTPALTWSGSVDNTWSLTNLEQNWNLNGVIGATASYSNSAALTFDDTANPANTNIVIDAGAVVQPYSLVFNNNSLAYSLSGGSIGGAASVTLTGTAGVVFYNANTYTGGTSIESAELLQLASGASLGSGALTVNAGTLDLGGNNQAVTSLSGVAGTITSTAPVGILSVSQTIATAFGGVLQNSAPGTLGLSFNGTGGGSLLLKGANSYSGGTHVTGGILQLGNASALGSGGLTANAGVVDLAGISPAAFPSLNGLAGTITSSATGAVALTVNPTAASNFGGVMQNGSGTLALVLNGGSVPLTLYGANTYTGGTTISAGTLQLGNGVSDGSVVGNISNSGAVAVNAATPQAYTGVISGSGGLVLSAGSLSLGGFNTFTGGTIVNGGTLALNAGGSAGAHRWVADHQPGGCGAGDRGKCVGLWERDVGHADHDQRRHSGCRPEWRRSVSRQLHAHGRLADQRLRRRRLRHSRRLHSDHGGHECIVGNRRAIRTQKPHGDLQCRTGECSQWRRSAHFRPVDQ